MKKAKSRKRPVRRQRGKRDTLVSTTPDPDLIRFCASQEADRKLKIAIAHRYCALQGVEPTPEVIDELLRQRDGWVEDRVLAHDRKQRQRLFVLEAEIARLKKALWMFFL